MIARPTRRESRFDQIIHVGEVIDLPALPSKCFGLRERQSEDGLIEEFIFELAHR